MKKITSKNLSKRLAQYGALSMAIAGVADAEGQIVYTDINPDGGGFDSAYDLDLNNDGTVEFSIFTGQTSLGPVNAVGMNASAAGNSFVGSAPLYVYPFALNSGDVISSGQTTWFDANSSTGTLNYVSCYNGTGGSNWCGVVDKYLGLRFTLNGNLHYGWARLDVDAAGMNWSIKDYAYNTTAGQSIEAGQTSLSVEEFSTSDIKIVTLNQSIGLYNIPEATNYTVYDIKGKSVLDGMTNGNQFVIEANGVSNGIYILELSDPNSDAVIRKKIVL